MASDNNGEPLAVGDQVTLQGVVTKVTEGSEVVTIETAEPANKPKLKTTVALRGESVTKVAK